MQLDKKNDFPYQYKKMSFIVLDFGLHPFNFRSIKVLTLYEMTLYT